MFIQKRFDSVQVSVAGYTAGQRAKHVPRGKYVAGVSILAGTSITMFLLVVLNVFPFTPRYMIPVAGMMVGNAMTVTGVTMKQLRDDIKMQLNLVKKSFTTLTEPDPGLISFSGLIDLSYVRRWRRHWH